MVKTSRNRMFRGVFLRNGYTGDTEDMILAEDIEPYISEPDNIYDLAGNCFGLLSE